MVVLDNEGASETFVVYRVGPGFRRSPAMGYCSATDEYTFDMPTHREFGTLPDINHPATKGWLLHMLREARGSGLFVGTQECDDGTWEVRGWSGLLATGSTEGEALAAALLAAWGDA